MSSRQGQLSARETLEVEKCVRAVLMTGRKAPARRLPAEKRYDIHSNGDSMRSSLCAFW